jgi:hypothetical protein
MATVEQGMKVFTAVYKRIYRALAKEYQKLYRLNEVYLNPNTYVEVLDADVNPDDFKAIGYSIQPGADPSAISQTEKLLKAQQLLELLPMGILDPVKVMERVLVAAEQPKWQELLNQQVQQTGQPPQQPDPKAQELQMKLQADQQKAQMKQQELAFKSQLQQRDQEFTQAMEAQRMDHEMRIEQAKAALQAQALEHQTKAKMVASQAQHAQKVVHTEQTHRQKMSHAEQAARAKAANTPKK